MSTPLKAEALKYLSSGVLRPGFQLRVPEGQRKHSVDKENAGTEVGEGDAREQEGFGGSRQPRMYPQVL